jgi:SAM-dependent methyltransferase
MVKKQSKTRRQVAKHGIEKTVTEVSNRKLKGVLVHRVRAKDGYHQAHYKLERFGSRLFAAGMESYLAKRSHYNHAHPKNAARKILYSLPSFVAWAELMPGSLALEPVHDPSHRRLPTGKRLGGMDPVGVRTRTLVAGWLAREYVSDKQGQELRWLSLAGGTAAPSMLMVEAVRFDKAKLYYANIDLDSSAVEIARSLTALEGLQPSHTNLLVGDIFNRQLIEKATDKQPVDIIDMMGIFEYFEDKKSIELLQLALGFLKPGGIIIAGNMRHDHPQLNLHKRGIGWPDVIPRSTEQIIEICSQAKIQKTELDIYQPADGVYSVFRIRKD